MFFSAEYAGGFAMGRFLLTDYPVISYSNSGKAYRKLSGWLLVLQKRLREMMIYMRKRKEERRLAAAMALHPRLGSDSGLAVVPEHILVDCVFARLS